MNRHALRRSPIGMRAWMALAGTLLFLMAPWSASAAYDLYISPDPIDGSQGVVTAPTNVASLADFLTNLPVNVTTPTVGIEAAGTNGYVFWYWEKVAGDGSVLIVDPNSASSAIQYSGVNDVTIKAHFKLPDVTLTVTSTNEAGTAVGNPVPVLLTTTNGATVNAGVTSPYIFGANNDERAVCQGYIRTGSEPAVNTSGDSSMTFVMTNDTQVSWTWRTDNKLTVNITGPGSVVVNPETADRWYTNGQIVSLQAIPTAPNVFSDWSGDISGTNATTNIVMNSPMEVTATFSAPGDVLLTVVSRDMDNRVVGDPRVNGVPFEGGPAPRSHNELLRIQVDEDEIINPPPGGDSSHRVVLQGFVKDFGSGPVSGIDDTGVFAIEQNTKYTFSWLTQYRLNATADAAVDSDGTIQLVPAGEAGGDDEFWYDAGTVVQLRALVQAGSFLNWRGPVETDAVLFTNSVVMDGPKWVEAVFGVVPPDTDGDGLPDNWEARFGLNELNPTGDHGGFGDPDNDGVNNLQEYRISHLWATNSVHEASPIDADSDGDGLDDGYEFLYILNTEGGTNSVPGSQMNAQAVVTPTGIYGQDGNPDQDFLWNTLTGYETGVGLVNYSEYVGPDEIVPAAWPPIVTGGITKLVYRYEVNPFDTGDQSYSDVTDSEIVGGDVQGDGFDDGFEYSWDSWQGLHEGDPVGDPLGHRVPYRQDIDMIPVSAAVADFDEDGALDIAVVNQGLDEVSILLGDSSTNGVFGLPTATIGVGSFPRAIAAADLNNDGTTNDVIVVNGSNDSVTVILAMGDGTFATGVDYAVGSYPSALAVGDFNGDTNLDVAVANESGGTISVLLGGGGAAFVVSPPVAVGIGPTFIAAGSLWGTASSGVCDLAVANGGSDTWTVLQNNGSGVFTSFGTVAAGSQPSCIAIDDFDDDGTNDVVVSSYADSYVRTYVGQGDGTFVEPAGSEFLLGAGRGPAHFCVSDFDSDSDGQPGYPDLAVANQAAVPGVVSILLGEQSASWLQGATVDVGAAPSWVAAADFNNDGINDLLVVERDDDSIYVAFGRGGGLFLPPARYETSQVVGDRRFNPAVLHVQPPDSGRRDYDLVYNSESGGVGDWLTDAMEYDAWQDATSPLLRPEWPDRRRSSHPFLWDPDGDGVPDGWEMAFGYDPWDRDTDDDGENDGDENPDGDWFAQMGGLKHHEVYLATNFDPRTAWWHVVPPGTLDGLGPNTVVFANREEILGPRGMAAIAAHDPNDTATHPFSDDTDGDGMWDGWEWYVNLDAKSAADAGVDIESDGLSNFDEFFSFHTSTNNQSALVVVPGWFNKTHPTDPRDGDTDWDQLGDSGEQGSFNYEPGPITRAFDPGAMWFIVAGGGLNPTSADTEGDHFPDAWETEYAGTGDSTDWTNGMNGTVEDRHGDYDGDGLVNYQEYMCGAVYMWQFQYNNGSVAWQAGKGLYQYEPYDFFDETLSGGGQWNIGPGGRAPRYWDPHLIIGPPWHPVPWKFITAAEHPTGLWFSGSDPSDKDTDLDGMDDFYEAYHGLNPLFGILDIVRSKVSGTDLVAAWLDEFDVAILVVPDIRLYPWISGDPIMDPDQDELPNIFESIQSDVEPPQYYHTDPSPMWITDTSSDQSWVNQHFWLGDVFGNPSDPHWYWDDDVLELLRNPPSYLYSFEVNEGFETDNDNIADRAELVDDPASPGVTDPLESQSPIKRRALYLNGDAAGRTLSDLTHFPTEFRNFTLEMWARPQVPNTGTEQILIERTAFLPQGNLMGFPSSRRANFRMGMDGAGRPYVGYHGSGNNYIFVEAKAPAAAALPPDQWSHVAGTYDGDFQAGGQWVGMLKLYVNGDLAVAVPSSEIPANGWFGGLGDQGPTNTGFIFSMPIVVGAGDQNPDGWPHNAPILVGPAAGLTHSQPDLWKHFNGWVDQVHVWDGARTQTQIQNSMMRRYTRAEVAVLVTNTPAMRYVFSFDDLPDPDHSSIAPDGFALLNGRPIAYTGSPWWANAPDRSMVYTDYRYLPWIDNLAGHAPTDPPRDSMIPEASGTNQYPNTSNPYTLVYRHESYFEIEHHPDLSVPLTSDTNSAFAVFPDLLPLGWAEADEDVVLWDGASGLTSGDADGDGLPDDWEEAFGLDPRSTDGVHGANGDPDSDGLVNLYEYLALVDHGIALNPHSFGTFTGNQLSDFFAVPAGGWLTFGEIYDDSDVLPDDWERQWPMLMDPHYYNRDEDPDGDEWNNQEEYLAGTDPSDTQSAPSPTISGFLGYNGPIDRDAIDGAAAFFHVLAYESATMDTEPVPADVQEVDGVVTFTFTNISSRTVWLFAYKSLETWEPFHAGDAYGIRGPIRAGLDGVTDVRIPVLDQPEMPWYQSFEWTRPLNISDVYVRISDFDHGNTLLLTRWVHNNRNWYENIANAWPFPNNWVHAPDSFFQAVDYQEATSMDGRDYSFGLPPGNYKWQVASNSVSAGAIFAEGLFHVPNYAPPSAEVVSPAGGDIVVHQVYEFTWKSDPMLPMPRFEVWIAPTNGAWAWSSSIATPVADQDGEYTVSLPLEATESGLFGNGIWTNGMYHWWVRGHNNSEPGAPSEPGKFQIAVTNLPNSGAPGIEGRVMYFGKATTSNLVVRAYKSPDFRGRAQGQITMDADGDFALYGLRHVRYTLRAFIDVNTNGVPDEWEPQGMAREIDGAYYEFRADRYALRVFDLENTHRIEGASILIRDRDTDNDNVPDGWEWENLHNSPHGMSHTGQEDLDGDGLSNLEEYGLDTDPMSADTDGDGLSDGDEVNLYGSNPTSGDSDGDGLADGDEVAMGLSATNTDDDEDGVPTLLECSWDGAAGYAAGADLNPGARDTDGDTVDDLMEIAAGSDPLDPGEAELVSITGLLMDLSGRASVAWSVHSNVNSVDVQYTVEFSDDLVNWAAIGVLTSDGDSGAAVSRSDDQLRGSLGYYRLRLEIE